MRIYCGTAVFMLLCTTNLLSTSAVPKNCKAHGGGDIQINIYDQNSNQEECNAQVKVDTDSEQNNGKTSCIQINITQDSSGGIEKPSINNKCFQEIPRPFYELIPKMGFYKLHTNAKNWEAAKATCEKEGAHLAIMNSAEEVAILQEFRRRLPKILGGPNDDIIYLGQTDKQAEGVWMTIFNEPLSLTGYTNWEYGEPHNSTNEDCGCIVSTSGRLHDCLCSDVIPFFCELELKDCSH